MTNFVDERVLQARHKIGSEMMMLMYYFIVIAFCVKVLYFGMELQECMTEFIIMISAPLYQNIRARQMKVILSDFKKASKASTVSAIFVGIVILLLSIWKLEGGINPTEAISSIVSFAVTFALARYGFTHIEKKRAEKLARTYDEDENA